MSKIELTCKIRELKELKALAEELEAEISGIENQIKAEMTAQGVDELKIDVYKIRWVTVNSTRFDSLQLKRAMPELYNQFTKQITTRRFLVA